MPLFSLFYLFYWLLYIFLYSIALFVIILFIGHKFKFTKFIKSFFSSCNSSAQQEDEDLARGTWTSHTTQVYSFRQKLDKGSLQKKSIWSNFNAFNCFVHYTLQSVSEYFTFCWVFTWPSAVTWQIVRDEGINLPSPICNHSMVQCVAGMITTTKCFGKNLGTIFLASNPSLQLPFSNSYM